MILKNLPGENDERKESLFREKKLGTEIYTYIYIFVHINIYIYIYIYYI